MSLEADQRLLPSLDYRVASPAGFDLDHRHQRGGLEAGFPGEAGDKIHCFGIEHEWVSRFPSPPFSAVLERGG